VSGICGDRNAFLPRQDIEWTLSPDSVGTFVQAGDERECLKSLFHQVANKRSGTYAVTRTIPATRVLTRGTPNPADDIQVLQGQTWLSLTSPSEGTSHVTVLAPDAENWDQRRQTATIYWVDVQWVLPPPALVTAAQPHTLTTTVQRVSGKPLPGWIVRYEITDRNVTSFGANNPTTVDVPTDQNGMASANLVPAGKSSSAQIRIQVIRPSQPDDDLTAMVVGQGFTTVTWSAPDPKVTLFGPQAAGVGSTVTYRAEISNAGDITAKQLTASARIPPIMKFVQSDPPAKVLGDKLTWEFGDLPPKATRFVNIVCTTTANGTVRFCVGVTSADQGPSQMLTAEACVNTNVFSSALAIRLTGPNVGQVGQPVTFEIEVTNTGSEPLNRVVIRDRLPVGLEHRTERGNLIERALEPLAPGKSVKIAVELVPTQAGRLCHTVEAVADGGHSATATACVNVTEPPKPQPKPSLDLAIEGPAQGRVGEQLVYVIKVTNTGNVPLTGVRIANTFDASLDPRRASPGFDHDALLKREILWVVNRLGPGETVTREAKHECIQESAAAWCRVNVETSEGLRTVKETTTTILPAPRKPAVPKEPPPKIEEPAKPQPSQIRGELKIAIACLQDPIQINTTTTYIVAIENGRNVSDQNVTLTVLLPLGLEFVKVNGPVVAAGNSPDGRTVQMTPIKEVRAGEKLNPFYIEVRGVRIGKHTLRVRADSRQSPQAVEAQEDTTVNQRVSD
jgi:uncharacterized repeat protein (TIGR01451 family)